MGSEVYPDVGMTNVMVWNSAHELLFVNRLNAAHVAMVARCFDQLLFTSFSLVYSVLPLSRGVAVKRWGIAGSSTGRV
jgi:hypothetical protein